MNKDFLSRGKGLFMNNPGLLKIPILGIPFMSNDLPEEFSPKGETTCIDSHPPMYLNKN